MGNRSSFATGIVSTARLGGTGARVIPNLFTAARLSMAWLRVNPFGLLQLIAHRTSGIVRTTHSLLNSLVEPLDGFIQSFVLILEFN